MISDSIACKSQILFNDKPLYRWPRFEIVIKTIGFYNN